MSVNFSAVLRANWLVIFIIALVAALTTFIPIIAGYNVSDGRLFYPVSIGSPADTSTYLSWIEQSRQGHLAGISLYNTDPQPRVFFHPLFFLGGQLARVFNVSNLAIYLLLRTIGVIFLTIMAYWFFAQIFTQKRLVVFATVVLLFGTSLNSLLYASSPEVWSAEWNIFLSISQTVLNSFSLGLMLWLFSIFIFSEQRSRVHLLKLALISNLLVLIHPYYVLLSFVILGVWSIYVSRIEKDYYFISKYSWIVLLSFPAIFLVVYELSANKALGIWAFMQSSVPSGFAPEFLLGYLLVFIFFIAAAFSVKEEPNRVKVFVFLWLLINCAIIALPGDRFDRKLVQGLQVPIIVLIAWGVVWMIENGAETIKKHQRNFLIALAALFVLPNSLLLERDASIYQDNRGPLYAQTQDFRNGIEWLKLNTAETDSILSSYYTSNLIPGIAGRKVYHGHYDQTINAGLKWNIARSVLRSFVSHVDPLKSLVKQEKINYIFVDEEIKFDGGLDTNKRDYLKLVYENSDVQIYQIDQNNLD